MNVVERYAVGLALLRFHTPVVDWLATPLRPLLEHQQVEAARVAPGLIAGIGDQLPWWRRTDSEFWRFVLAGLPVTQIIFLSEFGMLILRSPLPATVPMLVALFALRTALTLPVLMAGAALLTAT